MNRLDYVKEHVGSGLSFLPELQQRVVKTLLALLKVRELEDYDVASFSIIHDLEKEVKTKIQLKEVKEPFGLAILHGMRGIAFVFMEATDEETKDIQKYLEGLLSRPKDTLEQYMKQEFGLEAKALYNPDDVPDFLPQEKVRMAFFAMTNSGNKEDFQIIFPEIISDSEIIAVISRYYTERGYSVKEDMSMMFSARKESKVTLITVSNWTAWPVV